MELTLDKLIAELQNLRVRHPEAADKLVYVDGATLSDNVEVDEGNACLYVA